VKIHLTEKSELVRVAYSAETETGRAEVWALFQRVVLQSYGISVVHMTLFSAYGAHRVSGRHVRFCGFLPRIEGPVLEAVEQK
jgi:hypothetical protein